MKKDWRSNRKYHLFKSVTGHFVLTDSTNRNEWKIWTDSINEYLLKLITFGIIESDAWIDDQYFSKNELDMIQDALKITV